MLVLHISMGPCVRARVHMPSDLLPVLRLPTASACSSSLHECPQPTGALSLHKRKPETLCPPGFSFTSPCQATVKAQLIACSQAYTPELLGDEAEPVPERSPAGPLAFPVLLLPLCSLVSP